MWRRGPVIALHWSAAFLLLAQLAGGAGATHWRWAFVIVGAAWLALVVAGGPLGRPGPKLRGLFRAGFVPFHLALYATIAAAVGLNLAALTGLVPDALAWRALMVLLGLATFHAIFHLWRHTALGDGALRMILPRRLHRHI